MKMVKVKMNTTNTPVGLEFLPMSVVKVIVSLVRCFDSRCRARSRRPGYESKWLDSETQTTRIDKGDQRQNQRVQIAMQLTENTWYTLAIRNMAKHTRNQLVLSLCLLLEGWISVVYAFTSYFKISVQPLF